MFKFANQVLITFLTLYYSSILRILIKPNNSSNWYFSVFPGYSCRINPRWRIPYWSEGEGGGRGGTRCNAKIANRPNKMWREQRGDGESALSIANNGETSAIPRGMTTKTHVNVRETRRNARMRAKRATRHDGEKPKNLPRSEFPSIVI